MKKFIFFSLVLVIFFIVLVLDIFLNNGGSLKQKTIPVPTPIPNPGQAISTFSYPSMDEQTELKKNGILGNLISKLPYNGVYFSFVFDFSKNSFVLRLDKNNITKGNSNFDVFLKNNSIQDRTWFDNLSVVYQ